MTLDTINKIREVLGDKWPHKTYTPGLGYKTRRCNLLRIDVDPYYPEPTWIWDGLGKCDVDEARNALTLAMLELALENGYVLSRDRTSLMWEVLGHSNPSLFDLLVEVVMWENNQ